MVVVSLIASCWVIWCKRRIVFDDLGFMCCQCVLTAYVCFTCCSQYGYAVAMYAVPIQLVIHANVSYLQRSYIANSLQV